MRQGLGPGRLGLVGVMQFIGAHLFKDGAAPPVALRDLRQMGIQMPHDLILGLRQKAEVPFIAKDAGHETDRERTGIPERREVARVVVQFPQALFAPVEMIDLFIGRFAHGLFERGLPGRERLRLVERLGRDFPGVVDPHQARDVPPFGLIEFRRRMPRGRIGPFFPNPARTGQVFEQGVRLHQQLIKRAVFSGRRGLMTHFSVSSIDLGKAGHDKGFLY